MANRHWILGLVCILSSCNHAQLEPKAYLNWLGNSSHGLLKEKEINGLVYEIKYLTADAMALNELKDVHPVPENFRQVRKGYGDLLYFRLRMYEKDGQQIEKYLEHKGYNPLETESYLNYEAHQDWRLICEKDTSPCRLFVFSNTYGAGAEFDVAMAFSKSPSQVVGDMTVECDDKISNNGTLKFLFKGSDLQKIPSIRI